MQVFTHAKPGLVGGRLFTLRADYRAADRRDTKKEEKRKLTFPGVGSAFFPSKAILL